MQGLAAITEMEMEYDEWVSTIQPEDSEEVIARHTKLAEAASNGLKEFEEYGLEMGIINKEDVKAARAAGMVLHKFKLECDRFVPHIPDTSKVIFTEEEKGQAERLNNSMCVMRSDSDFELPDFTIPPTVAWRAFVDFREKVRSQILEDLVKS
jgi:hypothetical protein